MSADFYLKLGDRKPTLQAALWSGESSTAVDITGASVKLLVRKRGVTSEYNAAIVTAASGIVKYEWAGTEFSEAGTYLAEWEVTFSDGTKGTFPNTGYFSIQVVDDLN